MYDSEQRSPSVELLKQNGIDRNTPIVAYHALVADHSPSFHRADSPKAPETIPALLATKVRRVRLRLLLALEFSGQLRLPLCLERCLFREHHTHTPA